VDDKKYYEKKICLVKASLEMFINAFDQLGLVRDQAKTSVIPYYCIHDEEEQGQESGRKG